MGKRRQEIYGSSFAPFRDGEGKPVARAAWLDDPRELPRQSVPQIVAALRGRS